MRLWRRVEEIDAVDVAKNLLGFGRAGDGVGKAVEPTAVDEHRPPGSQLRQMEVAAGEEHAVSPRGGCEQPVVRSIAKGGGPGSRRNAQDTRNHGDRDDYHERQISDDSEPERCASFTLACPRLDAAPAISRPAPPQQDNQRQHPGLEREPRHLLGSGDSSSRWFSSNPAIVATTSSCPHT